MSLVLKHMASVLEAILSMLLYLAHAEERSRK